MTTWTIYDSPDDHPGLFVLRAFDVNSGYPVPRRAVTVHVSLESARAALPPGLACFPRDDGDPPSVVETWL